MQLGGAGRIDSNEISKETNRIDTEIDSEKLHGKVAIAIQSKVQGQRQRSPRYVVDRMKLDTAEPLMSKIAVACVVERNNSRKIWRQTHRHLRNEHILNPFR